MLKSRCFKNGLAPDYLCNIVPPVVGEAAHNIVCEIIAIPKNSIVDSYIENVNFFRLQ